MRVNWRRRGHGSSPDRARDQRTPQTRRTPQRSGLQRKSPRAHAIAPATKIARPNSKVRRRPEMVGQGPVDQLPYGKGGQIDGEGELNLRCRDVEACGNRRQRGLVHGERERAERNERGDQPLSARASGERRRLDLPTRGLIGGALDGPFRLESGATCCAASGGCSSITLIDATTKPARDETREPSLALKERLKLATRSWSRFAAAEFPIRATGRASCLQKCGDLLQVQAVENALWRDTTFAGHEHAPAGEIRVDAEHAAQFQGSAMPSPVQVEPVRGSH